MTRLCERPGCSAPASVTYGFEASRSVVWLGVLDADPDRRHLVGVLCRRHADALTPPRGWWLDDRRIAVPTLFHVARTEESGPDTPATPPSAPEGEPAATPEPSGEASAALPRRRRRVSDDTEELAFDFDPATTSETESPAPAVPSMDVPPAPRPDTGRRQPDVATAAPDPDETRAMAWTPVFDRSDDLGGVLSARSPLLSRAFGIDRPPR